MHLTFCAKRMPGGSFGCALTMIELRAAAPSRAVSALITGLAANALAFSILRSRTRSLSIASTSPDSLSNSSCSAASLVRSSSSAFCITASMRAALAARLFSSAVICSAIVFISVPSWANFG